MRVSGIRSFVSRRAGVALGFVAMLAVSSVAFAQGTQPPPPPPAQTPPQPAAPAPPAPDHFKFGGDAALVFLTIAPQGDADFEAVLGKLKEALAKSDKPERKQQLAHWQVTKADVQNSGMSMYIMVINPVVKETSYDLVKVLAEGFPPAELDTLYKKLSSVIKNINVINLTKVVDMAGTSGLTALAVVKN
jgi:hypothetical protein